MAYFSSKSTWLSLVDAADSAAPDSGAAAADASLDGLPGIEARDADARVGAESESVFQSPGAEFPRLGFPGLSDSHSGTDEIGEIPPARQSADGAPLAFQDYRPCFEPTDSEGSPLAPESMSAEDLDYLRITRDLRHRLFFHFKEWEFGPALLEDHVRLAQAQSNPEEALAEYCRARHVAVTLVERWGQEKYLLAWIEADRVIAEIHQLIGNDESCEMYAREGLERIKRNRFGSNLDMRITRLTVRFFNLLGRR